MTINTVEAAHEQRTVPLLHSTPPGPDIHEWEGGIVIVPIQCCSQVELNVNWHQHESMLMLS